MLGISGLAEVRPSPDLVCRPLRVAALASTGDRGCLLLADKQVAAVLVRIDCDGESRDGDAPGVGDSFLEAGFGRCAVAVAPLFASPVEAIA